MVISCQITTLKTGNYLNPNPNPNPASNPKRKAGNPGMATKCPLSRDLNISLVVVIASSPPSLVVNGCFLTFVRYSDFRTQYIRHSSIGRKVVFFTNYYSNYD